MATTVSQMGHTDLQSHPLHGCCAELTGSLQCLLYLGPLPLYPFTNVDASLTTILESKQLTVGTLINRTCCFLVRDPETQSQNSLRMMPYCVPLSLLPLSSDPSYTMLLSAYGIDNT